MKALLIGCGSKFGLVLLNSLLASGWEVHSISGSDLEPHENLRHLEINWFNYNINTIWDMFILSMANY